MFKYFFGVTGTLKVLPSIKMDILKTKYGVENLYYMPSVYGENNRVKRGIRMFADNDHYAALVRSINEEIIKGRPVMVFCRYFHEMTNFDVSEEFKTIKKKSLCLGEETDKTSIPTIVNTATKVSRITLSTITFGRGTDFIVTESKVIEAGGMHVIQTFISEEESEAVQIEGRTARQGHKGTY
jgi:preprotein translocase subunit SecA